MMIVQQPRYRRIVIQEGPSVLGYERFREQEERTTYANVVEIVRAVLTAGTWELDEEMLQTFARIFFGTMSAAGEVVATATDTELAAQRVETAVGFLLSGIQALVENGGELPAVPGREPDEERSRYFPNVTSPPSCGTSSIHTRPAGTFRSPAFVDSVTALSRRLLRPGAADQPSVVEDHRVAAALELGLGHRVAGGVGVARVADRDPQHEHGVGGELVAVGGVAVLVDVAAVAEDPAGRVTGRERRREAVRGLALRQVVLGRPTAGSRRDGSSCAAAFLADRAHVGEQVVRRAAARSSRKKPGRALACRSRCRRRCIRSSVTLAAPLVTIEPSTGETMPMSLARIDRTGPTSPGMSE